MYLLLLHQLKISPNSVGEAMILGTPVVSSDVGGVKNMLTHNEEGFLYQHDAPYMLAFYVMELFENKENVLNFQKMQNNMQKQLMMRIRI